MRIILLGAPGAGKGSVGKPLSERLNIPVISTGDIFRHNIRNNTELGKTAKAYMDKGELVPDEVTVSIVEDRLKQDDCIDGFILDGFPRNVFQAEALDALFKSMSIKLDIVINISLADEKIVSRLSNRMVCSQCGETYNKVTRNPITEWICDVCGGKVIVRSDDNAETVRKRLDTYNKQTQPLIDYYESKNLLATVDNDSSIEQGLLDTIAVIENFRKL